MILIKRYALVVALLVAAVLLANYLSSARKTPVAPSSSPAVTRVGMPGSAPPAAENPLNSERTPDRPPTPGAVGPAGPASVVHPTGHASGRQVHWPGGHTPAAGATRDAGRTALILRLA